MRVCLLNLILQRGADPGKNCIISYFQAACRETGFIWEIQVACTWLNR